MNVKWEQHKLRKVACINPKTNIPDNFKYVDLESVVGTSLIKAKLTTKQLAPSRAQRVAKKGDIFYQTVRPYQKNNFLFDINNYDFQYVFSTGYAQLRSEINNYFLFSYLQRQRFVNLILRRSTGTSYPAISSKDLSEIKIIFPRNSKEQENIGKIINLIDALITLQQRKLEQLKQLKKAMLQQLFVDKNNKQPNSRFKNFKGNWEQHRLEEVAQVTMGQSPSSKNYTDNPNDYVLVQGNADLKSNKISPRVWTKEITKQVHKGEIIMTVRAPVGYLAMANMDAVIGRGVAAIDGNKYLYYLLQTKLMDRTWEKLSSGSTFESISSNDIKNLEIKVTETEEEKLITKLMNTVTYFVTLQKNNLTQLTTLKKYLLQNLFI
nr:restriction endonuclease subunit S [Limosilactobacillus reuteri]